MATSRPHTLWKPVVQLGAVSLLSAIAGESARAVGGPLLQTLGAGAAAVGIVAGGGELLGYTLRLGAGYFADRPGGAWRLLLAGTVAGLLPVVLLPLAPGWRIAAVLLVCERIGRALRTPARDVMLAAAGEAVGHGRGFGVHRMFDQAGGVVGPLALAAMVAGGMAYRPALALLVIPASGAVPLLMTMRPPHARPRAAGARNAKLPRKFWLLCAVGGLLAAGTVDFALISFHCTATGRVGLAGVPVLYALAMSVEGVAALLLGFLLERLGPRALLITAAMSSAAAPLVFMATTTPFIAVSLWSIGMGGQYTLLRALVPRYVSPEMRGAAFGWFNTVFGVGWFLGSAAMGFAYSHHPAAVVWIVIALQLCGAGPLAFGGLSISVRQFHSKNSIVQRPK